MNKTSGKFTGGSPTQPLNAENVELGKQGADIATSVASGNFLAALGAILRGGAERMKGVDKRTTEQISKMLFENDPRILNNYYKSLGKTKINPNPQFKTGLFAGPLGASTATYQARRNK